MSWTDERIDQLKAMWERGLTASQIADELGGVSRNAVIGKAHRLGLQSRPSPVKANEVPKKAAPPMRKPASETEAPKPAAPVQHAAPSPIRPAAPAPAPAPVAAAPETEAPKPQPRIISVGPGGFLRQARATSRRRSRPRRRAVWCRPSPARKSPARPPCWT